MSDHGPKIDPRDLDRYITGNYGERQFDDEPDDDPPDEMTPEEEAAYRAESEHDSIEAERCYEDYRRAVEAGEIDPTPDPNAPF